MRREHEIALLGPHGCLGRALAEGQSVVLRVRGDCMHPHLTDGVQVRVERARVLLPGDLVAFHCPDQGRLLVHRVLGYLRHRGAWKLLTMADRGLKPDPFVDLPRLLGRVIDRGGQPLRVPPASRVEAVGRYLRWCVRLLVEGARRRAAP